METATGSGSGPNLKFDVVNLGSKDRVEQDDKAHYADLYTLNHDGLPQVAENPTALQLINELESFDRSFCQQGDQDVRDRTGTFNIMWVLLNYTNISEIQALQRTC